MSRGTGCQGVLYFWGLIVGLLVLAGIGGCALGSPLTPQALPTSTLPMSPTPSVVWFPPTATWTPLPTVEITPTPDLRPGLGIDLLGDGFEPPAVWVPQAAAGGIGSVRGSELTLAVDQPQGYLLIFRRVPVLNDFYLEITASASLCRGDDQYGVVFRAADANSFYRYVLTCDGRARLDRVVRGVTAVLQPFTLSNVIPPGAPASNRLGVWALGETMRFFANDLFVFEIQDPVLTEGMIGVFARSAGDTALTVSFSDLVVRQIIP